MHYDHNMIGKNIEAANLAARIKQDVQAQIERMVKEHDVRPGLAAVRVGEDPASAVYVRNKIRACEEVGIHSEHHALPESTSTCRTARPDRLFERA